MKQRRFTLIELLTVLAILAILAAILFSALGRARAQANKVQCASNLRQFGTAGFLYATDWNQLLPTHGPSWHTRFYSEFGAMNWYDRVKHYADDDRILECPQLFSSIAPEQLYKRRGYCLNTSYGAAKTWPWWAPNPKPTPFPPTVKLLRAESFWFADAGLEWHNGPKRWVAFWALSLKPEVGGGSTWQPYPWGGSSNGAENPAFGRGHLGMNAQFTMGDGHVQAVSLTEILGWEPTDLDVFRALPSTFE